MGICSNSNGENNVEELLRRKKSSCDSVAVNGSYCCPVRLENEGTPYNL